MIKPFLKKTRDQSGDTIIEVLIVLAVLGLGLSISYATANAGLTRSRNAQEHSEALGVINSQIEMLRSALAKRVTIPADPNAYFCMWSDSGNPLTVVSFGVYRVPADPKLDTAIGQTSGPNVYPTRCVNDFYHTSVVYVDQGGGKGFYDVRTRWDAAGNLGRQQEELTYKVNQTAVDLGLGVHTPPPYSGSPVLRTPSVNIRVQKIQPTNGKTAPGCNSGNPRVPITGADVSLNTGHRGTTDGTGTATILELVEGQRYTASYSNSNYGTCNGERVEAIATPNNPRVDTIVVTSQCTHTPGVPATYTNPQPYDHYRTVYTDHYRWDWIENIWIEWRVQWPELTSMPAIAFIGDFDNAYGINTWPNTNGIWMTFGPNFGNYAHFRNSHVVEYTTSEEVFIGNYADPAVEITPAIPARDDCT